MWVYRREVATPLTFDNEGDVNENGKKAIGLTLHVHHAFLYSSLPSLHDYDVKMPNVTFCGRLEDKTKTNFLFLFLTFDTEF